MADSNGPPDHLVRRHAFLIHWRLRMADVFSKQKRSQVMSRIRGNGNKATELELIRVFRSQRIVGWRRNQRVFGRPDFVFPKERIAIFVDGCFWHQCPKHCNQPSTNAEFWLRKFEINRLRDHLVNRELRLQGWMVVRIWEHELRVDHRSKLLKRLRSILNDGK
jgi:DNA mismatch endonuclease, patch repair protein